LKTAYLLGEERKYQNKKNGIEISKMELQKLFISSD
jgi:hypothetical protein